MDENLNIFLSKGEILTKDQARQYSPLALAFIGDGVYELFIRTKVLNKNKKASTLHRESAREVKASAQARKILEIMDLLEEDEIYIFKRGRNAKPHTMAKNASVIDYKNATGLEALFGYLYLTGQDLRMSQLIDLMEEK